MINDILGIAGNSKSSAAVAEGGAIHAAGPVGVGGPESPAPSGGDSTGDLPVAAHQRSRTDSACVAEAVDYPMRFLLSGMKAGYQARIELYEADGDEGWTVGERCDLLVGVSVNFLTASPSANLNSFSIRQRELSIFVNQDCERIDICLYVRTKQSYLKGGIQLPQGGMVTVESVIDRASLFGMSSFGIALY